MNINVRGKNIVVTDGLRNAVEKELSKLERYLAEDDTIQASLSTVRREHKVELTVRTRFHDVRVEEAGDDMYDVIRSAGDVLERRLRKYKNQLAAKFEGKATSADAPVRLGNVLGGAPDEDAAGHEEEADEIVIVRTKRFGIKPMNPEEAVLQMELIGHDFFVFANVDNDFETNVVYKRKNGGYGLIEPEFE